MKFIFGNLDDKTYLNILYNFNSGKQKPNSHRGIKI